MLSFAALLLAAVGAVDAHTIFQRVHVNGVDQGFGVGVRYPSVRNSICAVLALAHITL